MTMAADAVARRGRGREEPATLLASERTKG